MMRKRSNCTALLMACALTASMMTACSADEKINYYNNTMDGFVSYEAEDAANDIAYPYDVPNTEEYNEIKENAFLSAAEHPLSTFSVDVDTASYSNIRRMIHEETQVNPDAVRIEEMINYFSYDYPAPEGEVPFSVTTEMYDCPWNAESELMLIGLQAEEIDLEGRAPMNLVFLIDVSGSMYDANKLPLVQKAFSMLTEYLNENDRVSIVTYAGAEAVVLDGVPGNDYMTITESINSLTAGGSTAGAAGITKAYALAEQHFIEGGNNRVLLATDGDLNVGLSTEEELTELIEEKRESGVFLSVLGFGTGNLKDDRLEALADNGNGSYAYIDSLLEARKVLVQEMGGTLYTVAKDVKIQAEFNADAVESYRLIGYENRVLANEDFENDAVDAGEIGAGHSVTALYEVILKEDTVQTDAQFMNIALRYKAPDGDESQLVEYPVTIGSVTSEIMPQNLAFAAAVTEFGMVLRGSAYAGTSGYDSIHMLLDQTNMDNEYRQEFAALVDAVFANADYYIPEQETLPETAPAAETAAPTETIETTEETAEPSLSAEDIAAMEQVDKILLDWVQSDVFAAMPESERAIETQRILLDLSKNGLIEENSISYVSGTVSFSYACGALGSVRVKDFDPMEN